MKIHSRIKVALSAVLLCSPLAAAELPITLSGAVELEANMVNDYAGARTVDIVAATATIGMDTQINGRVSATLAFLYEEDDTPFGLDEGYVTLKMSDATSVVAGRMFVPFGHFESNMVSDPLTLELGETSETAMMLAMESSQVSASLYTFNGDTDEDAAVLANENDALSFGANISYAGDNMSFGASYISNIADSDGLQGDTVPFSVDSYVPGLGVHFAYRINRLSIIAEYVATMDKFMTTDLGGFVADATPTATNVELAFDTGSAVIAAAYQMSDDASDLGLPETAASAAVPFDVMEGAALGIEYRTTEDYAGADDSAVTAQLAVEF